jgi:hypothetical protein
MNYNIKGIKKNTRLFILAGTLVFAIIVFLILRFSPLLGSKIKFEATFPGSALGTFDSSKNTSSTNMRNSMTKIMTSDTFALEYFQTKSDKGQIITSKSQILRFSDQVELLSYYAERGSKKSFNLLNDRIIESFKLQTSLFATEISTKTMKADEAKSETLVAEQISYCRALIEGYSKFGQRRDLDLVKSLSSKLLPLCAKDNVLPAQTRIAVPKEGSIPDFSSTPTPKPTQTSGISQNSSTNQTSTGQSSRVATPTAAPQKDTSYMNVVDLSSIDIYSIKLLGQLDKGWIPVYENCFNILKGALMDSDTPLYFAGYDIESKGYIPYLGTAADYEFDQQMKIILHLAECGFTNEPTISHLKEQLFNTKTFFKSYNILTATPGTEVESISGYAIMARIARIANDKVTYELCVERILWNTATSATSKIYGLPFQETEDGTIRVYSSDAISSLKAIY